MLSEAYLKTYKDITANEVLILVLMENALRVWKQRQQSVHASSLNPCFNGKCSQSRIKDWMLFNDDEES